MRKVVLYFSEFGNTESIAKRIAEKTGADICKIEPVEPYPVRSLIWCVWG